MSFLSAKCSLYVERLICRYPQTSPPFALCSVKPTDLFAHYPTQFALLSSSLHWKDGCKKISLQKKYLFAEAKNTLNSSDRHHVCSWLPHQLTYPILCIWSSGTGIAKRRTFIFPGFSNCVTSSICFLNRCTIYTADDSLASHKLSLHCASIYA